MSLRTIVGGAAAAYGAYKAIDIGVQSLEVKKAYQQVEEQVLEAKDLRGAYVIAAEKYFFDGLVHFADENSLKSCSLSELHLQEAYQKGGEEAIREAISPYLEMADNKEEIIQALLLDLENPGDRDESLEIKLVSAGIPPGADVFKKENLLSIKAQGSQVASVKAALKENCNILVLFKDEKNPLDKGKVYTLDQFVIMNFERMRETASQWREVQLQPRSGENPLVARYRAEAWSKAKAFHYIMDRTIADIRKIQKIRADRIAGKVEEGSDEKIRDLLFSLSVKFEDFSIYRNRHLIRPEAKL